MSNFDANGNLHGSDGRYQHQKRDEVSVDLGEPKSWVVGLPVIVTVNPDGSVNYEADTADASAAVKEAWYDDEDAVAEEVMLAALDAIDQDNATRRAASGDGVVG